MSKIFMFLALSWQKIRAKGTTLLGYDFTKGLAARQSPLFAPVRRHPMLFAIENQPVFGTLV
jgi:hypothetical protein